MPHAHPGRDRRVRRPCVQGAQPCGAGMRPLPARGRTRRKQRRPGSTREDEAGGYGLVPRRDRPAPDALFCGAPSADLRDEAPHPAQARRAERRR
jgi:hypothetical protein